MARFEITAPNGSRYEITAPDDASESDVMSYAQKQFAMTEQPRQEPIDPITAKGRANAAELERKGFAPSPMLTGVSALAPGLVDKAFSGVEAGLNYISGGKLGMPYDEALATKKAQRDRAWEQSPVQYGLGAATSILSAPAVLPSAGPTVSGIASGVTYGGAYSAGEQDWSRPQEALKETLSDAAKSGAVGGVVGNVLGRFQPRAGASQARYQNALDESNQAVLAGQRQGVDIPRGINYGDTTFGNAVSATTGRLGSLPIMGAPVATAAQTARQQMADRVDDIANALAPGATADSAGRAMRHAADQYVGAGSRAQADRLYSQVENALPQGATGHLANTRQAVARALADLDEGASNAGIGVLRNLDDALNRPQGMSYRGLQRKRSEIGAIRDDFMRGSNADQQMAGRLYGPLTEDLQAITRQGGARAETLWNRANQGYRGITERRAALEGVVGRSGDKQATNILDNVMRLSLGKGGGDARRLMQVRKSVDQNTWSQVQAAAIRRMGQGPQSGAEAMMGGGGVAEFSAAKFLTAYRKMSAEGRAALFGGRTADLARNIDDLARIAERVDRVAKLGNPSGTAGAAMIGALAVGGAGIMGWLDEAIKASPGLAAGFGLASMLARPSQVRQMSRMVQAMGQVANGTATQAGVNAAVAGMARAIASDPDNKGSTTERDVFEHLMRQITGR